MSTSDAAELSSLTSALEEMQARVAGLAGRYEGTTRDDVLGALYEAERALRQAVRATSTARRALA